MARALRLYIDRQIGNLQSFHIKTAVKRVKPQPLRSYIFLACTHEKKNPANQKIVSNQYIVLFWQYWGTSINIVLNNSYVTWASYWITHMSHEQRIMYQINSKMTILVGNPFADIYSKQMRTFKTICLFFFHDGPDTNGCWRHMPPRYHRDFRPFVSLEIISDSSHM